ncbi:hypothetical protein [Streptomyces sp. 8L]|uniref:hypothetical protein n=1 Tax=Streptomyces sp. 8L TaxID=2877242 RepID=UPI001CD26705|nr:hypothetical protein [Streptomyces sp. 8L]MCA1218479.1 hypothetical protein [Streptomyces sp. 8L]
MTAPVASVLPLRPTTHRQIEQAATAYATPLLAYINDRLPDGDWSLSEDLAQDVWLEVLLHGIRSEDLDGSEAGMPVWLARTARTVVRRHVSPVGDIDWAQLTLVLGHSDTWPAHWHDVLMDDGHAALLQLAATEYTEAGRAMAAPTLVAAA